MERPSTSNFNLGEWVENAYIDNEVVVEMGVNVAWYVEDPSPLAGPWFGRDGVGFRVNVNLSLLEGFGVSLTVKYLPTDENASVYVHSDYLMQRNVSIIDLKGFGDSKNEAYCQAVILQTPSYLSIQAHWVFDEQESGNHQLDVKLEVTFYNGTKYLKAVIPITLELLTDT